MNIISSIDWRQPLWLLIALQPLLLWLIISLLKKRQKENFADAHLLPWIEVHKNKAWWQRLLSRNTAYVLAWLLFAMSLAGPRIPDQSTNHQNDTLLDIMLLVDLSRSMKATDIKPSRLRRATLEAYELLSMAKNSRIGITVYAGRAHLFVPLSSDLKALKFYLQDLDSVRLPTHGSDPGAAFTLAKKELTMAKAKQKQVIIWMSDGDIDAKNISHIEAEIKQLERQNIDTYILGLGTVEGSAIPLVDGGWLESEGQGVISKMDSELLKHFSALGSGRFASVTDDESDWAGLYQNGILKSLSKNNQGDTQQWEEYFHWLLLPAILFLLMALFPFSMRLSGKASNLLLMPVVFIIITQSQPLYADEQVFKTTVLEGIEAYKNTNFALSKSQFINGVLSAETDQERAIALHNLGNAVFQTGDYARSAELFNDALRYSPQQKSSANNQQLSLALYALLEKRRRESRSGNFATPSDNSILFDLPEQRPIMLNTKAVNLLKVSLPDMPKAELDGLLKKGLKRFLLMQGESTQTAEKKKAQQNIEQARIYFMGLEEKTSSSLWKRLFEVEEGFPGKLKKPKTIPGVQPW